MVPGSISGNSITDMDNIAIYVCCYRGDLHFLKPLCESIRYFCGGIPIFLIKDGEFSTSQVRRLGQIYEFNPAEVPESLRKLRGWGIKKLYAFFQRDYERFLYLDADVVLLNDPFRLAFQTADFYVDTCGFQGVEEPLPGIRVRGGFPPAAARYTFDPARIRLFDPRFDLDQVLLFNTGQFFGRPGLLEPDAVTRCVGQIKGGGELFYCADQGVLNYLLNKGHQEGHFTLGGECFRLPGYDPPENWPTLTPQAVLNGDFHDRTLIHWAGPSKRGQEVPYGSILQAFQTLYYRRLHPLAYPFDICRRALSNRWRGMMSRGSRVLSAVRLNH
jgi:hypothetical protein